MDTFATLGDAFATVLASGTSTIMPYAQFMAWGFMVLGVAWIGLAVAFGSGGPPALATRLVITGGFYLVVVQASQVIGENIINGAVQFGLLAGGSSLNPDVFLRSPDSIFVIGLAQATDLAELADKSCGPVMLGGCLAHIGSYLPLIIASWTVLLTFAGIAIAVLLTYALFKFTILGALIILPAAVFVPAAGFATGVVKFAVHSAVQLMVLAMIVAVANLVFGELELHGGPGMMVAFPFLMGSLCLAGAALGSMYVAASLTSGAIVSAGTFLAAPAMGAAAARSAAGHLDAPATSALKAAGGETFRAMSAAANASQASISGMSRRTEARRPAQTDGGPPTGR
ncbi:MAG: type IV secretion system protein [Rhodospirillales bacterium]|nr:type IV secretion system protein [Rhodospirillales bacterium]